MNQETSLSTAADVPREVQSIRLRRTPNARRIQNFLLVWLDTNINEVNSEFYTDTIQKLKGQCDLYS